MNRDVRLASVLIGLLGVQNLAGIYLNLYIRVNDTSSDSGVFPAMFTSVAGALHTILGVLLGGLAILMTVTTWRQPDWRARALALATLGLIGLAAYAGFHFVRSGGEDAYSFLMEASFIGAILAGVALLVMFAKGELTNGATRRSDQPSLPAP